MSKTTEKTEDKADATAPRTPRIGEVITVKAAQGRKVMNNDASSFFSEKESSPVTVSVRIIRLLNDGDLIQTKAK